MVALEQKSGGPYSKDEREKRQNEVFRLHFEFGYSAVKIADLMKINRNTRLGYSNRNFLHTIINYGYWFAIRSVFD